MLKSILFGCLLQTTLLACAQKPIVLPDAVPPVDDRMYKEAIEKNTRSTQQYDGFHQTFEASVTWLNSDIYNLVLQRKGHFLQWDQGKLRQEREKAFQNMASNSQAFLNFTSPEPRYNDLNKANTIWKIYLESGGRRVEGKIKKSQAKLIENQVLYPHMDRFRTAYEVTFPIPMSVAEQSQAQIILTSPLGSAQFSYPALSKDTNF